MKVILISNIKGKGKINDIITISNGYAKNFLFQKQMAVPATKFNLWKLQKIINYNKITQANIIKQMQDLKKNIDKITLIFKISVFKNKIYKKITTKQIINNLIKNYNIKIDKKQFIIKNNLSYSELNYIKIKLYNNIIAILKIKIEKIEVLNDIQKSKK